MHGRQSITISASKICVCDVTHNTVNVNKHSNIALKLGKHQFHPFTLHPVMQRDLEIFTETTHQQSGNSIGSH